jgi:hypothetical protein
MESPQAHLERAEHCGTIARQQAANDPDAALLWVAIGTLEQDIAYTQQGFGVGLTDTHPPVRPLATGNVGNVVLFAPPSR